MSVNHNYFFYASCLLAIICLFVPIVWLEVSKEGYVVYGPTVPHVYIYGGFITGKDTSFEGIAFAIQFQRVCAVLFILLNLFTPRLKQFANQLILLILQALLLVLFPFWMLVYIGGVTNNSDGAGLTPHVHIGMVIYGLLVVLNISQFVAIIRRKNTETKRLIRQGRTSLHLLDQDYL